MGATFQHSRLASWRGGVSDAYAAPAFEYAYPGHDYSSVAPMPPNLHWAFVLLFSVLTLGIFGFVWLLIEANFVRKLDPDYTPMSLAIAGFIAIHAGNFFRATSMHTLSGSGMHGTGILLVLAGACCSLSARFRMRQILITYYNSVEPIGLFLSSVMTFFFGTFYLQHHFSRIARWKRTGYLEPQ